MTRFGILGPFVVTDAEGRELALGGHRQRSVLAALLLHENEVVATERLIDELWGEHVPATAHKVVHVYVSKLRKCLPDGTLVTRGGGYELVSDSIELDARLFARLVADGRAALQARRAEAAASLLGEALALWRGPPLVDFTYDAFAQADIARLEEERLVATEDHVDARLALGQHAGLVGELEAAVRAHPLRDRLRGQLMLALYRAGRQHEALEEFRQVSALLRDELGLEPSRALVELELSILRQDSVLDLVSQAVAARLPVPATPFIGRARELAEVTALVRGDGARLLTLTGAGGSGKTRLALRVAGECAAEYRDGARFVGFADIVDPELIAPTICQGLELADEAGVSPVQRIIDSLRDGSLLLVLDNLEQLVDGVTVLGELLGACPGLTMLVTSRAPLHLTAEQQYEVPLLEPEDAIDLFISRAHAVSPKLTVDAETIAAICERVDRLPLAIELAAARAKALPVDEILSRLQARLPVLGAGPRDAPRRQRTVQATIEWSCNLLTEARRQLFARLAVFAGGWTLNAGEVVCDADLDSLEALVDVALIRVDAGRYSMLQTLREYGLGQLQSAGALDQLRDRHAKWLLGMAHDELATPVGDLEHSRIGRERENSRAALEWAADRDDLEALAEMAAALMFAVWRPQGQLREAERWLALALARRSELPEPLRVHLLGAGRTLAWKQGDIETSAALSDEALALSRAMEDHEGTVRALMHRGIMAAERGDLAGDRAAVEEVIAYSREHVEDFLPIALCNLGDLQIAEGNLEEGRAACEESLELSRRRVPDRETGLEALINLTHIANLQHRYGDALDLGRRLLGASLGHADRLMAASAMMEIAWALAEQDQLDRSARLVGAALEFFEQSGITRQRTDMVCDRAVLATLRDRLDEAALQELLKAGRTMGLEAAASDALATGTSVSPA